MRQFYDFWGQWFAQPAAEKMRHLRQPGKGGYYPPASESPGFTGKADNKEYFHWRLGQGHPDASVLSDEVGTETERAFWTCHGLAWEWLHSHGLSHLNEIVVPRDCVLRIIHYPAQPDPTVGEAHRDFDLLTVSLPGTVPGLEALDYDGDGEPVFRPQEEGVQVGEMLEIYTGRGGACRAGCNVPLLTATTHRVRTPPNTERLKAAFFVLPPMDFELRPGYTAGDYLKTTLAKAGTDKIGVKP